MNFIKQNNFDMLNGPGVRVSLWVAGCNNFCKGCHNPETWDPNIGEEFTEKNIDELLSTLKLDYIEGLTLTGGDPMYPSNRSEILKIVKRCREELGFMKTIWIWSGSTYEELIKDDLAKEILENADVLVDGKFQLELKEPGLKWRGSSNQRIINLNETRKQNKIILME